MVNYKMAVNNIIIKRCRQLHNVLGLLLVLQISLWFISGLTMSVLPITQVRGEHLRLLPPVNWQLATVSPAQILAQHSDKATLSLSQRVSTEQQYALPVYLVQDSEQQYRYNAHSGALLQPLSEQQAIQSGLTQYSGNGSVSSITLLSELPQEVQHLSAPLWQLQFNDAENSTFYLDQYSGAVLRVRTDGWRLFDFMWMLHIMDYKDRHNFNNPLLISFSALSLLFTLTGIVLLWQKYRPKYRKAAV